MHYDRPVRELLADCFHELEAPFDRRDVLRWFERHYPLVKATTVSTHLAGLIEGTQSNPQFAGHPPLVRRIRHGLYEPGRGR